MKILILLKEIIDNQVKAFNKEPVVDEKTLIYLNQLPIDLKDQILDILRYDDNIKIKKIYKKPECIKLIFNLHSISIHYNYKSNYVLAFLYKNCFTGKKEDIVITELSKKVIEFFNS